MDKAKKESKPAAVTFTVRFEDGKEEKMTVAQISDLKDRRRYEVLNNRGEVVVRKGYRGI